MAAKLRWTLLGVAVAAGGLGSAYALGWQGPLSLLPFHSRCTVGATSTRGGSVLTNATVTFTGPNAARGCSAAVASGSWLRSAPASDSHLVCAMTNGRDRAVVADTGWKLVGSATCDWLATVGFTPDRS